MGKLESDNKSEIAAIDARLDNIRMFEISRVLEETLFGKQYYDAGIIKKIDVNAEMLKKYYAGLKGGADIQAKDLVNSTDAKNSKNRTQKKASPETNTITGDQADHKNVNEIEAEMKSLQSKRDAYREKFVSSAVLEASAEETIKDIETELANLREQPDRDWETFL